MLHKNCILVLSTEYLSSLCVVNLTIAYLNNFILHETLVCTKPGEFIYQERELPISRKGYTLLRIKQIGVCGTDLHAFEGTQPFFSYPRILGHELAATIVETDNNEFSVGEAVTFIPYYNCGVCIACKMRKENCCVNIKVCGVHADGGMVEYFSVPSYSLVKSEGLTYYSLALVEPLAILLP